jgi:hypothetical protein
MVKHAPSYMAPDEFKRLGERCFGFGWQKVLADFSGYDRVAINRYAAGERPVPRGLAVILLWASEKLDNGVIVQYLEPAGEIIDGSFIPT